VTEDAAAGPRLIKKYSNRKLYDTRSRRYITLERIGELVRSGEDVRVVDRASGADLTSVTLSQVVLETERKRGGAMSEMLLQQLVRGPGESLIGAVRQSITAGQELIQRAEERVTRPPEATIGEIQKTFRGLRPTNQRDVDAILERLDELAGRVEKLEAAAAPPASRPTRPRPARGRTRS
jgi:polyhydroxyalkanoate synthesis repressor PhaR